MTAAGPGRFHAEITASTGALAGLLDGADYALPVPTCPEWTLRQLTTHVGRAHRWAAEIVAARASEPVPFRQVPDGRLPDDPPRRPDWLRAGAARLTGVLGEAGTDRVWTHLGTGPATYWARRMAHETAVHLADAQIALGRRPELDPVTAVDGIDEFLGFVSRPGLGEEAQRLATVWQGHSLHIHVTGEGATGGEAGDAPAGEWTVRGEPGPPPSITVEPGHAKGDVAIRGPAPALLLVLTRRLPPDGPAVEVLGDRALLGAWLEATKF